MAKRKRDRQRITIDHFRGVHQEINPDDYTYSRAVMGLVDEHGGMLARLGGKISAGSNPMSSIWGLHQLRFKDNWGIVVHNGSSRDWYDHNAYKGPEDGFIITTPTADPTFEVIPADILPGDNWPHEPPKAPCHSDIKVHYGIFEYPVDDLLICYRSRGNTYTTGRTKKEDVPAAIQSIWNYFSNSYAGGVATNPWSIWRSKAACDPAIPMPYFRFYVYDTGQPEVFPFTPWHIILTWLEVQYSARSDRLAGVNPPPAAPNGAAYTHAFFSVNGGLAGIDVSDMIGNPDAALGIACGSGSMPIVTAGGSGLVSTQNWSGAVAGAVDAADANPTVNQYLYDENPAREVCTDKLVLSTNPSGWFEHVDSCFEE